MTYVCRTSIIDALQGAEVFTGLATGCASSKLWGYEAEDLNRANWMCYSYSRSNGFENPRFTQSVGSHAPMFITDAILSEFQRQRQLAVKGPQPRSTAVQPSASPSIASTKRTDETTALPDRIASRTRSLQQSENAPLPPQSSLPATPAPTAVATPPAMKALAKVPSAQSDQAVTLFQSSQGSSPNTLQEHRKRAFHHLWVRYGSHTDNGLIKETRRDLRLATDLGAIYIALAKAPSPNTGGSGHALQIDLMRARLWLWNSFGWQMSSGAGDAVFRQLDAATDSDSILEILVDVEVSERFDIDLS